MRGGHAHGTSKTPEEFPPGTEVEWFGRESTAPKDTPGWHGPAEVESNRDASKMVVRYLGSLKDVPVHLLRLSAEKVAFWVSEQAAATAPAAPV